MVIKAYKGNTKPIYKGIDYTGKKIAGWWWRRCFYAWYCWQWW